MHVKITSVFDPNLWPANFANGVDEKQIIFSRVKKVFPPVRFSYLGFIVFVINFYINLIKTFTVEECFSFYYSNFVNIIMTFAEWVHKFR